MLNRWLKLAQPCRELDRNRELPLFTQKDILLATALRNILEMITHVIKAFEHANAHCGVAIVALRNLISQLKDGKLVEFKFKVNLLLI